jgi:hypothetical protein
MVLLGSRVARVVSRSRVWWLRLPYRVDEEAQARGRQICPPWAGDVAEDPRAGIKGRLLVVVHKSPREKLVLDRGGAQDDVRNFPAEGGEHRAALFCWRNGVLHQQGAVFEAEHGHADVDGDVEKSNGLLEHPRVHPLSFQLLHGRQVRLPGKVWVPVSGFEV